MLINTQYSDRFITVSLYLNFMPYKQRVIEFDPGSSHHLKNQFPIKGASKRKSIAIPLSPAYEPLYILVV